MPPDDERDYEVGYGKPPHHTRFVKGQSGNPRGRPRGAKNMKTLLNKALNEFVTVTESGGRRKVSKREAIATQLVNRSAKADFKAIQILLVPHLLRRPAGDETRGTLMVAWPSATGTEVGCSMVRESPSVSRTRNAGAPRSAPWADNGSGARFLEFF
jgi:hypothetical protein